MIHIETTTIGKYSDVQEANQVLYWLTEQNYPVNDLYIHKVISNKKGGTSLDKIAAIGGILGLGLGILGASAFVPSPLMVFGLILIAILMVTYSYQKLFAKRDEQHGADYYILKAPTVEDAKMIKTLLGGAIA